MIQRSLKDQYLVFTKDSERKKNIQNDFELKKEEPS